MPAEDLPQFNASIQGQIQVTDAYFGVGFRGHVPNEGPLSGLSADEQLEWLRVDRTRAPQLVQDNALVVFLHYPRWATVCSDVGLLEELRAAWRRFGPPVTLAAAGGGAADQGR